MVAEYDYTDENGDLLYQVVRYEPKGFRQRRPDGRGGGWTYSLGDVRRVPYRLPELIEAASLGKTVYIAEGEKGCNSLIERELSATCNPGGAGKWNDSYSEVLRGADVVILPDNDDPGRKHAEQVARSLHGIAARVRVLELPGLPEKGDVFDWVGQ